MKRAKNKIYDLSRLARALWIEIRYIQEAVWRRLGRGSREPCGLKCTEKEYLPGDDIVEAREGNSVEIKIRFVFN